MVHPLSPHLTVMTAAVRKASKGLIRDFGEVGKLQSSEKSPGNFVSAADLKSEKILIEELQKARPKYGILSEEAGEIKGEDTSHRWLIDPLDGTRNFLHSIPYFAISLALEEQGEIISSIIYNPISDEMFYAEKGKGAYLAGPRYAERLRVSKRHRFEDMVGCISRPPLTGPVDHQLVQMFQKAITLKLPLRILGSASLDLAYVAAGRMDLFIAKSQNSWDIAAGLLLVREAGGMVTTFKGDHKTKAILQEGAILASSAEGLKKAQEIIES